MTDDGAHLGYGMEAALRGVLGGKEPEHRLTVAELRAEIMAASEQPGSYDECGRAIAKAVLEFLERHPEAHAMPAESSHKWPTGTDGSPDWSAIPTVTVEGLYQYMKRVEPDWFTVQRSRVFEGMTGFQWGWGVNAARHCLGLGPVPNPAIVTVGGRDDDEG